MRKAVVGGLVAVAVVCAVLVLGPTVWAQVRGRETGPGFDRLMLQGPGSEVGVTVRELRSEEMSASRPEGVFVEDVRSDSPASRAGLKRADVVVEFDGERVRSVRQFTRLVRETPPGRTVRTTIVRDGSRQTLDIAPEQSRQLSMAMPDFAREIERGMRNIPRDFEFDFPQRTTRGRLGLTLAPLSDQLASYFGVEEGVLVSEVAADSPASQAGIRAGDVITAIGGRTVRIPADVTAAVRESVPGSAVDIRIVRDKKEMTLKATVPDGRPTLRDRIPV